MKNVRKIALRLLEEYEACGKYVNLSLNSHLTDGLSERDMSFLTRLLYTTVERKLTLDYLAGALSGRPVCSLSERVLCLLRLGLCQLLYLEGIPPHAAVGETVALGRHAGERGFINGVLRGALRRQGALPFPRREKNAARYLSVVYSFPQPTVKRLLSLLGEEQTEQLLAAYNTPAPTTLHIHPQRISREAYLAACREAGITASATPHAPYGVRMDGGGRVHALPGFAEGLFFVQDEASQLAVGALDPRPGGVLVDVCAAPGGKSMAAALRMEDQGQIYSFDVHESKLSLIEATARRLGLTSLHIAKRDALVPDPALIGKADYVICDVPCSGLGVFGKKPDLRYKELSAAAELPALQQAILRAAAAYVKENGVLLYSTCTLLPEENEQVVEAFLRECGDFALSPMTVGDTVYERGYHTLYPHRDGTDGFFFARLCRTK